MARLVCETVTTVLSAVPKSWGLIIWVVFTLCIKHIGICLVIGWKCNFGWGITIPQWNLRDFIILLNLTIYISPNLLFQLNIGYRLVCTLNKVCIKMLLMRIFSIVYNAVYIFYNLVNILQLSTSYSVCQHIWLIINRLFLLIEK